MARLFLHDFNRRSVDRLVTLGSPLRPPPEGVNVVDQTRGILTHINTLPHNHDDVKVGEPSVSITLGAELLPLYSLLEVDTSSNPIPPFPCPDPLPPEYPHFQTVCITGRFVKGARLWGGSATLGQRLAGMGYATMLGDAEVWGDGITPSDVGYIDGANAFSPQLPRAGFAVWRCGAATPLAGRLPSMGVPAGAFPAAWG